MTSRIMHSLPGLCALALATLVVPRAHAGCGVYTPSSFHAGSRLLPGAPYLLRAALDDQAAGVGREKTMVGTWKEHWISEGTEGITDGTEIDAGYAQWHSDGTEMNISGLRSPLTGNVCMGEWEKTGPRQYRMNHFGISYNSTGLTLVGVAHIQQCLTLDEKGMNTSGTFTIDQYDESGNVLMHIQGKIIGTRVTMDTGYQKVE